MLRIAVLNFSRSFHLNQLKSVQGTFIDKDFYFIRVEKFKEKALFVSTSFSLFHLD